MPSETKEPDPQQESKIFGVSVRGWIAVTIISTVCYMSVRIIPVTEPLYTLCTMAIGFYFGQKKQ